MRLGTTPLCCFNCGALANWKDSLTGAARCRGCLISCGGGRPHVVIAVEPEAGEDDDTVPEEPEPSVAAIDDPMAVWDDLEATMPEAHDIQAVAEWMACALEEGKRQAAEIERYGTSGMLPGGQSS